MRTYPRLINPIRPQQQHTSQPVHRPAFTLVECLISLALLGITVAVLQLSLTITIRDVTTTTQIIQLALLAQRQSERVLALCIPSQGADTLNNLVIRWSTTSTPPFLTIHQTASLQRGADSLITHFTTTGICQ